MDACLRFLFRAEFMSATLPLFFVLSGACDFNSPETVEYRV